MSILIYWKTSKRMLFLSFEFLLKTRRFSIKSSNPKWIKRNRKFTKTFETHLQYFNIDSCIQISHRLISSLRYKNIKYSEFHSLIISRKIFSNILSKKKKRKFIQIPSFHFHPSCFSNLVSSSSKKGKDPFTSHAQ